MTPSDQIHKTNALIVGATQGIGLGFVKKLLTEPNITKLYATYRTLESDSKLMALKDKYPDTLECLKMDITDEAEVSRCVKSIRCQVNQLHLVINCVGILHEQAFQPEKSLQQINSEHLMRYFQVNSVGSILLAVRFVQSKS